MRDQAAEPVWPALWARQQRRVSQQRARPVLPREQPQVLAKLLAVPRQVAQPAAMAPVDRRPGLRFAQRVRPADRSARARSASR